MHSFRDKRTISEAFGGRSTLRMILQMVYIPQSQHYARALTFRDYSDAVGLVESCNTNKTPTHGPRIIWPEGPCFQGLRKHKMPCIHTSSCRAAQSSALPPPGTIPSSTAARVALSASTNRSFFSPTSTSDDPPTCPSHQELKASPKNYHLFSP